MLALAGGATATTLLGPASIAARQTPEATPAADTSTTAEFPLPSTLAADASPEFRAVADALVESMRRNMVPGTALGILFGDREEHATFGVASLNSLAPVTADTLFQIGSLTKTFTSTAIWRLIDEGALALDAPVRTYIPDLKLVDESVAAQVAISNLLDHSAGWYGDEGFDTGENDDAVARYVAERLPVLPQNFPPGAFFSYNNAGFTLLGRLIEVARGPRITRRSKTSCSAPSASPTACSIAMPFGNARTSMVISPCRSTAASRSRLPRRSGFPVRLIPPAASGQTPGT